MTQNSLPGFEEVERRPVKFYFCPRRCITSRRRTVSWDEEQGVFLCDSCGRIDKKRTKEWQDAGNTK